MTLGARVGDAERHSILRRRHGDGVIAHRRLDGDHRLRHVALDAGAARAFSAMPRVRRQPRADVLMTPRAQRVVRGGQLSVPLDVGNVRIVVTGRAGEIASSRSKATGFQESITGAVDLELVVTAGAGRVIEMKRIVPESLTRKIGKRRPAVTPQHVR